jgi:hypothetical protein
MRKLVVGVVFVLLGLLVSCATSKSGEYKPITASEAGNFSVLGSVQITFTPSGGENTVTEAVKQQAYLKLKEKAGEQYQGNIDIRNIVITKTKETNALALATLGPLASTVSKPEFSATGDVVMFTNAASAAQAVEGALARAAEQALKNAPPKSKIAIVNITAVDRNYANFIAGELEFIWVNAGFFIADRSELDRIRQEQNFQMSGEVDDATAVSIGKFAGADVIVTGTIDGEGNLRRLRLRALNTQTAQVVGVASERL